MIEKYPLPEGWRWARLGEICEVVTGSTPSTADPYNWNGEILWATPNDMGKLKGFTIDNTERRISEKGFKSCSTKLLPPGSVLLTTRAPIGHLAINTKPMCTNQGFKSLIPGPQVYSWFLFFILKYFVPTLQFMGRGQTFTEISKSQVQDFKIPLPPLSEQKRIAAKIQELMQEVESARTAYEKQLEAAEALPAAYLREVFESEEAKRWEKKRLGEVCEIRNGYAFKSTDFISKGVPVIRISDIQNEMVGASKSIRVPEKYLQVFRDFVVKKGDILIAMSGATTGKVGIYADELVALQNQRVGKFEPQAGLLLNEFFWCIAQKISQQILTKAYGSAQPNISSNDIKQFEIPLPSLPEQRCIAAKLKEKTAQAEKLRTSIERQLEAINALPQAILTKAFRGEL